MKYLGSKSTLTPFIMDSIGDAVLQDVRTVLDAFAGSCAVARAFQQRGFTVFTNDVLPFSYVMQRAWFGCTAQDATDQAAHIERLNGLQGREGYVHATFSPRGDRMFFTEENASKIDAVREEIQRLRDSSEISESLYYVLLASLLEAVSVVSNTAGTYGAFLKRFNACALKPLTLKPLAITGDERPHRCFNGDVVEVCRSVSADLVYLDPPYVPRQYGGNYHVLNIIAQNHKPTVKGVTGQAPDTPWSAFSSKRAARAAMEELVRSLQCKYIAMSYSSAGMLSRDFLVQLLETRGPVQVHEMAYRAYRSQVTPTTPKSVTEYVFVCTCGGAPPPVGAVPRPLLLTEAPAPPRRRGRLRPMFTWVGGKAKMRDVLLDKVSSIRGAFNTYYEPFLGGGMLLLALEPSRAVCSDMNGHVVRFFSLLHRQFDELLECYTAFLSTECAAGGDDDDDHAAAFYRIRDRFNDDATDPMQRVVMFLYLINHCFNGVYRVNKNGKFNVPKGSKKSRPFLDVANARAVSAYLQASEVSFACQDFEETIRDAQQGDLVFLDPPYDKVTSQGHAEYTAGGFGREDQRRVAAAFRDLDSRGCYVIATNSNTETIRSLYSGYQHTVVPSNAQCSRDLQKRKRGSYEELIITNF